MSKLLAAFALLLLCTSAWAQNNRAACPITAAQAAAIDYKPAAAACKVRCCPPPMAACRAAAHCCCSHPPKSRTHASLPLNLPPQTGSSKEQLCNGCICALTNAFAPVLAANGVNAAGLTQADATAAITSCISVVLGPITRAGINLNTLMGLQQCSAAPPCLAALVPAAAP
jgi:hypothetical protein